MQRRGAGAGVLLLVVAALVMVVPLLLRPVLVMGSATSAPMPEPPQVGDCLLTDDDTVTVVSCDLPHLSEVTYRWLADDRERWSLGTDSGCSAFVDTFLGFTGTVEGNWMVPVQTWSAPLQAPASERINSRGWTACTVGAGMRSLYTGTLRSITATRRPPETSYCFEIDSWSGSNVTRPCTRPHTFEVLASGGLLVSDPGRTAAPLNPDGSPDILAGVGLPAQVAAEVDAECTRVASTLLNTSDPTRGGLLRVEVRPSYFSRSPDGSATAVLSADCVIRSADARLLTGSLVGLGSATVPFG